jgi:hypothetical protein
MLSWNGNDVITLYESPDVSAAGINWYVFFGTNPDALELMCEDLSEPICDPGILDYTTTYHWQVIAKNNNGITRGSIWSFTTQSP